MIQITSPVIFAAVSIPTPKMENGEITWETTGKKATTSITYHTVGWTIHKQEIPSGNVEASGVPYAVIMGEESGSEDLPNGQVRTTFTYSKEEVTDALVRAKDSTGKSMAVKNGEIVYVSAIMVVRSGNTVISPQYKDLSRIKKAQTWGSPSDLDQYYNIPMTLSLAKEEIHKITKIIGDPEITEIVTTEVPGTTINVTFSESITRNGKTAKIKESYLQKRMDKKRD